MRILEPGYIDKRTMGYIRLCYLAGRYRAKSEFEVLRNIRVAEEHAEMIMTRLKNVYPVIPQKNLAFMGGIRSDKFFLDGGIELMLNCDYIYLLPNWKKSRGAKNEWKIAQKAGIPLLEI